MRRVTASAVLGTLLILISSAACKPPATEEVAAQTGVKEREIPVVRTAPVEERDMVSVLEVTSKLESDREVSLFPELPGIAVEILAEEGDAVREGQVLARLDHRDEDLAARDAEVALEEAKDTLRGAELAVEEATSMLENAAAGARQAERDYERDQALSRNENVVNPLSKQALEAKLLERDQARNSQNQAEIALRRRELERDTARTSIARSEVALERATLNRAKKEIRAPFDGVISLRNIRIGDSVGTGEAAFIVTDTANVRATFMRPQEELQLFGGLASTESSADGPELTLDATAESYPGSVFEGWIERISPTIDAASGQFRVTARLRAAGDEEANGGELLPGMLVRMRIVTDRHARTLAIPKRALRREGDRRFVLVVDGASTGEATLRRVDVEPGFEDDEYVEVVPLVEAELAADERIVLVGARDLADGDPARIDEDADVSPELGDDELMDDPAGADDAMAGSDGAGGADAAGEDA